MATSEERLNGLARAMHEAIEKDRVQQTILSKVPCRWDYLPTWYQDSLREAARAALRWLGFADDFCPEPGVIASAVAALADELCSCGADDTANWTLSEANCGLRRATALLGGTQPAAEAGTEGGEGVDG